MLVQTFGPQGCVEGLDRGIVGWIARPAEGDPHPHSDKTTGP